MDAMSSGGSSAFYDWIVAKNKVVLNGAKCLILRLMTETEQNEMEMINMGKTDPGEQISIFIQDQVSLPVLPSPGSPLVFNTLGGSSRQYMKPHVLNSDISSTGSPSQKYPVESNKIVAAARDQANGNIFSDTTSLLHQAPIAGGQETNNFPIDQQPSNLLPQAQQTAWIIGNNDSSQTSQTTQQQPTAAAADAESQAQDQELVKYAISIALGLMAISATFLGAMLVPAIQNKKIYLTHKFLFKAFISLSLASFVSAVFLLLLPALGRPFSSALVKIVKLTMFIAIGFIVSAFVCAFFVISAELNSDS